MQGWEHENPVKDWRELMPKMEKADEQETFFESVGLRGKSPLAGKTNTVENDPELQQLAAQLGVGAKDLLLFREMMLDRYGQHYSDTEGTE